MKREDNIIKKLLNKVTIEQWQKALRVIIICMAFMAISEGIFEIPAIEEFFGSGLIEGKSGWLVYAIIWIVMFAQVAIIPIPALPILVACNQIPNLVANGSEIGNLFSLTTLFFVVFVCSATITGAIASYWIGRTLGKPAIKWVAGSNEDYELWSKKLNSKTGKWIYGATVLFPVFPDDLISLVVGSIKMNFSFYVIVNAICKFIGLYCMLLFMRIPGLDIFFGKEGNGPPIALIVYILILIVAIILKKILTKISDRKQPKEVKLEEIKEKILYILNKKKSAYKDLIIDYNLDINTRTYLGSKIIIHKYYIVNKNNKKQKVRILIDCKANNYKQIIFDKSYKLTELYNTLIEDFKQCDF